MPGSGSLTIERTECRGRELLLKSASETVLLVEDEPGMRRLAKRNLANAAYLESS
jgi:hypothetical protein